MDEERRELALLTRSMAAYLSWLGESGATTIPAGGRLPAASVEAKPVEPAPAPADAPAAQPLFAFAAADPPQETRSSVPLPERISRLSVIAEDAAVCTRCRLHTGRTRSVFARGNPAARLAFVGEGPGRDEDREGAPFVGKAGQLLDKMIAAMGLSQDDVYICNVVKCRPPENRTPMPDEAKACEPYLTRQLDLVGPEVIVALGKTAVSFLLETDRPMSGLRGRWYAYHGTPVMPTFHPAFLLRSPQFKRDVWEDLQLVMARLGLPVPARRE